MLQAFVSKLISDDPKIGVIVSSEMSFKNLLNAFGALAKYQYPNQEIHRRINDLIKRLNEAEENRNRIVHSCYIRGEDGDRRMKHSARHKKGLVVDEEKIDLTKYEVIVRQMGEALKDLNALYIDLTGHTPKLG